MDTNTLIQPWQKYYAPSICPGYWEVLKQLGSQGLIFIPSVVIQEIERTEDDLLAWVRSSGIPVMEQTEGVISALQRIYSSNPTHERLVDSTRQRSLADPWVIAHALHEGATVVTKEELVTAVTNKIKIPNVCENMGIRWLNDHDFIKEVGMTFGCALGQPASALPTLP